MTLLRDTKIVRGRGALFRGRIFATCALCFLGLAIYAAYIPAMVAKHLRSMSTSRVASHKVIPAPSNRTIDK